MVVIIEIVHTAFQTCMCVYVCLCVFVCVHVHIVKSELRSIYVTLLFSV
jgi:hypothetical protein